MTGDKKPGCAWPRTPGSIESYPNQHRGISPDVNQGWRAELATLVARSPGLGIEPDLGNLTPAEGIGLLIHLRGQA